MGGCEFLADSDEVRKTVSCYLWWQMPRAENPVWEFRRAAVRRFWPSIPFTSHRPRQLPRTRRTRRRLSVRPRRRVGGRDEQHDDRCTLPDDPQHHIQSRRPVRRVTRARPFDQGRSVQLSTSYRLLRHQRLGRPHHPHRWAVGSSDAVACCTVSGLLFHWFTSGCCLWRAGHFLPAGNNNNDNNNKTIYKTSYNGGSNLNCT